MSKIKFSQNELSEIESLEVRGGTSVSAMSQEYCSNNAKGCGDGVDQGHCTNDASGCGSPVNRQ